jgi:hypothetical protein
MDGLHVGDDLVVGEAGKQALFADRADGPGLFGGRRGAFGGSTLTSGWLLAALVSGFGLLVLRPVIVQLLSGAAGYRPRQQGNAVAFRFAGERAFPL